MLKRIDHMILVSLFAFIFFIVLYQFRLLDDNRLTSWMWVFDGVDASVFFLYLLAGILAAYFLSRVVLPERTSGAVLFLISFIACIPFFSEPEVIVDSSRYFTQAKHLEVYGIKFFLSEWGGEVGAWTDMPLVPMLYGLIFKVFGESRIYIQIFTALLFSSTVFLTYMIGNALFDEDTGFTAGTLLLGMPYIYTQVPLMLVDVPAMFLLSLSVFAFLRALERGGIWQAVTAISLFLAFYAKYSLWLMLSVLGIVFIVYFVQGQAGRDKVVKRGVTVAVAAGILIGSVFLYKYDLFAGQMSFLQEYQRPGLKRWGESWLSTFFFQIHPFISIAALFSVYAAFKKRDIRYLVISFLVILFFILQIKRIRYTLPIFPMITLMASYGLSMIKERKVRRYIVLCAVISSLVLSLFFYLPFLKNMSASNLQEAGIFLDSIGSEEVEIVTVPSENTVINSAVTVPLIDMFTGRRLIYNYVSEDKLLDDIRESSLRFTWGYKNPEYYAGDTGKDVNDRTVVVVTSESGRYETEYVREATKGLSLKAVFDRSTGIFSYVTEVRVYQ